MAGLDGRVKKLESVLFGGEDLCKCVGKLIDADYHALITDDGHCTSCGLPVMSEARWREFKLQLVRAYPEEEVGHE